MPAVVIINVSLALVAINEFTEMTFIKDYALILIIAGMLFGVRLSNHSDKFESTK